MDRRVLLMVFPATVAPLGGQAQGFCSKAPKDNLDCNRSFVNKVEYRYVSPCLCSCVLL